MHFELLRKQCHLKIRHTYRPTYELDDWFKLEILIYKFQKYHYFQVHRESNKGNNTPTFFYKFVSFCLTRLCILGEDHSLDLIRAVLKLRRFWTVKPVNTQVGFSFIREIKDRRRACLQYHTMWNNPRRC